MWLVVFLYIDLFNMILYILIHIKIIHWKIKRFDSNRRRIKARYHFKWFIVSLTSMSATDAASGMLVMNSVGGHFQRFFSEETDFSISESFFHRVHILSTEKTKTPFRRTPWVDCDFGIFSASNKPEHSYTDTDEPHRGWFVVSYRNYVMLDYPSSP